MQERVMDVWQMPGTLCTGQSRLGMLLPKGCCLRSTETASGLEAEMPTSPEKVPEPLRGKPKSFSLASGVSPTLGVTCT